jgi:hypothetical protein
LALASGLAEGESPDSASSATKLGSAPPVFAVALRARADERRVEAVSRLLVETAVATFAHFGYRD